jgi:hypothetical protein
MTMIAVIPKGIIVKPAVITGSLRNIQKVNATKVHRHAASRTQLLVRTTALYHLDIPKHLSSKKWSPSILIDSTPFPAIVAANGILSFSGVIQSGSMMEDIGTLEVVRPSINFCCATTGRSLHILIVINARNAPPRFRMIAEYVKPRNACQLGDVASVETDAIVWASETRADASKASYHAKRFSTR